VSNKFLLDEEEKAKTASVAGLKASFLWKITTLHGADFFYSSRFGMGYHYRDGLAYYFSFKSNKFCGRGEDKRGCSKLPGFRQS
jgi:hypothetical protein